MSRKTDPYALTQRQRKRSGRKKESRRAKDNYRKSRHTTYAS